MAHSAKGEEHEPSGRGDPRILERPGRDMAAAFAALTGLMLGHAMLETARDALFLAQLPTSHLPWAYLATAAATVAAIELPHRGFGRALASPSRRGVSALLIGAALITAGLWAATIWRPDIALYALYVWPAAVAALTLSQLWALFARGYDMARAKKAAAVLGAGGLVGAMLGSAAAAGLAQVIAARELVVIAAAIMAASGCLPWLMSGRFARRGEQATPALGTVAGQGPMEPGFRRLWSLSASPRVRRYLARLLGLAVLAGLAVTIADLVFKLAVVEVAGKDSLATVFGAFYAALAALALLVQVVIAPRLLAVLGINRALWILPLLLLAAACGFAVTVGFIAVLLMRAADGGLGGSLHRRGIEVLHLALPLEFRTRARALIDGAASCAGQGLAALVVIAALWLGADLAQVAIFAAVASGAWLVAMLGLESRYLDLFRQTLREGVIEGRLEVPELDLRSLEALLQAFNNPDERVIVNAMELLEHSGRSGVIPALILFHPAPRVVLRALDILMASGRSDFVPITERLLRSDDAEIRAAALRARAAARGDHMAGLAIDDALRDALDDPSAIVRATALVGLAAAGLASADELAGAIDEIVSADEAATADGDEPEGPAENRSGGDARLALVRAIRHYGVDIAAMPVFDRALHRLAELDEPQLAIEIAGLAAERRDDSFLPLLVPMLESRSTRAAARRALLAIGAPALRILDGALGNPELSLKLRRHIPRTISKLPGAEPAAILLAHLERATDDRIIFKILRGLGRMVADAPELPLDRLRLTRLTRAAMARAMALQTWHQAIVSHPRGGATLLASMLKEMAARALERVFRLLGLRYPGEDFRLMHRGIASGDRASRADSIEVLERVVDGELRGDIIALVTGEPGDRQPVPPVADGLRAMVADSSIALRALAVHCVAELGLDELRGDLAALVDDQSESVARVAARALAHLHGTDGSEGGGDESEAADAG